MNTRTKKPSTLCAALGRAGLARTGAMLALALGAAQAGATTYTVPLQFTLTLVAPVCSLSVDGSSVNAPLATPTPVALPTMNVTPQPLSAINTPDGILTSMTTLTDVLADGPGMTKSGYSINRRISTPPNAIANCTLGTPMTVRVTKASTVTNSAFPELMAGAPGAGPTATSLPIGMVMGIAKFGTIVGTSGYLGTTWNSSLPSVSTTADGSDQTIALTAIFISNNNTTKLTGGHAGQWTYTFNVNLDF